MTSTTSQILEFSKDLSTEVRKYKESSKEKGEFSVFVLQNLQKYKKHRNLLPQAPPMRSTPRKCPNRKSLLLKMMNMATSLTMMYLIKVF